MTDQDYLARLNSAAKYPSIGTYHGLNPADGRLIEADVTAFTGPIILSEKVNGTGTRIVLTAAGDWFLGSREELIYARGDRIENPALSIVSTLKPLAERLASNWPEQESVSYAFFLEVYGHRIGPAAKQYTAAGATGFRLFDVAVIPGEVPGWEREKISSWREHGGQQFLDETELGKLATWEDIPLVPRVAAVDAGALPTGIEDTLAFLHAQLPATGVALDAGAGGQGEGLVLRAADRSTIAKARFEDYARTLRPPREHMPGVSPWPKGRKR